MGICHFVYKGLFYFGLVIFSLQTAFAQEWIYTTSKGDTLWDFSKKYLYHVTYWPKIKKINNVSNPRRLQPNRQLRIPLEWVKVNPVAAKVITVYGQVRLQRHEHKGNKEDIQPGLLLHLGDSIQTAADSNISIEFADASVITVHENSQAVFDHLTAYGDSGMVDSRIRLNQGRIETRVRPAIGAGSRFEIHTPSAISAVRGTEYRLTSDSQKQTTNMEVLKGKVSIAADKKTIVVPQGFGSQVAKGAAPIPARELLKAPTLKELPNRIRQLNYPFSWQSIEAAKQYRVEISAREDFNIVSWNRVLEGSQINLPDLSEGEHFIRVRAIDELELEGLNQTAKLLIDVRPQPPILLQPQQEQVLRDVGPELRWSESFDAKSYNLQISRDENFSNIIHEQDGIEGSSLELSQLNTPQEYYWRLASVTADGEQGPFSLPKKYIVKAIPAQPSTVFSADSEQITLSWQAGADEQTYEIQLAEDPDFKNLLSHEVIQKPELVIPQEYLLVRYFRVRLLEADGYTGAWSTIQKIDPLPDNSWLYIFIPSALLILLL